MSTLHTTSAKEPSILAKTLVSMERRGRYSEALIQVGHIWKDIAELPDVNGFEPRDAAEMLLRCGSLIGYHGQNQQIPDSHLICKNLLTNAHKRFAEIGIAEKVAECENHLAIAYWRTGEYPEAETYLASAFSHDIPANSDVRLHSHVVASLLNFACKRHKENLQYVGLYESDLGKRESDYLKGILCSNIGLSYRNLGNLSDALAYQELAKYHYQRAQHKIYQAAAENNLAFLYKELRKFGKAHEAIDNATRLFKQLKDKTREGYSLDSKALVYFAESKYHDALKAVNRGLSILQGSENSGYLVDTLLTKAKILLYLDSFSDAVLSLSEAVTIARKQTGDKAAIRLIQEFETALEAKNSPPKKNIAADDFELVLPKSISHFKDYRGIWINSSRLESIGLTVGSLAVVVKTKVDRGDLVAVAEVESEEVSCGFYDSDFGIVCLEGAEGEPQIFDEKEVRILGKIVGVCNTGRNEDGKMIVESLNI